MRILLLEDDPLQADEIIDSLRGEFGESCSVELLESEEDFVEQLDIVAMSPPDVAVFDVRVVYSLRAGSFKQAPEGEPRRAGIRCADAIAKKAPCVPIILYTILEREDLGKDSSSMTPKYRYVCKPSESLGPLLDQIREVTKSQGS